MRTIYSKSSSVKKANLSMVMIISIVVILTMAVLAMYISIVVKDQYRANDTAIEINNVDASLDVLEHVGETRIKAVLRAATIEDYNIILNQNKSTILAHLDKMLPEKATNIEVVYKENIKEYIHGENMRAYNVIVISVTFENNDTYNLAYYIRNAEGYPNEGVSFQKGEFIFKWKN